MDRIDLEREHYKAAWLCIILAFICFYFSSCTTPEPTPQPSSVASPSPRAKVFSNGWHAEYDQWLDAAFETMPEYAFTQICPKGTSNKKLAWRYFWKNIAIHESALTLTTQYKENLGIDYITKKQVVSEGLLQLSYQDKRGYPECDFKYEEDILKAPKDVSKNIFNPKLQFKCAMGIAKKLATQKRLFKAYWSTAREGQSAGVAFRKGFPECN